VWGVAVQCGINLLHTLLLWKQAWWSSVSAIKSVKRLNYTRIEIRIKLMARGATIEENRQVVTDEPVEFEKELAEVQDCRKSPDHSRGIYRICQHVTGWACKH
jgi:hypothetical protein